MVPSVRSGRNRIITGITLPITKHNALVTDVRDMARTIREAFVIARSGRPGPVLVDVCKDAQQASTDFHWPETVTLPGLVEPTEPDREELAQYPRRLDLGHRVLDYDYAFEPGQDHDGVTLTVPAEAVGDEQDHAVQQVRHGAR